jgi:hypothetical protein
VQTPLKIIRRPSAWGRCPPSSIRDPEYFPKLSHTSLHVQKHFTRPKIIHVTLPARGVSLSAISVVMPCRPFAVKLCKKNRQKSNQSEPRTRGAAHETTKPQSSLSHQLSHRKFVRCRVDGEACVPAPKRCVKLQSFANMFPCYHMLPRCIFQRTSNGNWVCLGGQTSE